MRSCQASLAGTCFFNCLWCQSHRDKRHYRKKNALANSPRWIFRTNTSRHTFQSDVSLLWRNRLHKALEEIEVPKQASSMWLPRLQDVLSKIHVSTVCRINRILHGLLCRTRFTLVAFSNSEQLAFARSSIFKKTTRVNLVRHSKPCSILYVCIRKMFVHFGMFVIYVQNSVLLDSYQQASVSEPLSKGTDIRVWKQYCRLECHFQYSQRWRICKEKKR